MNRLLPSIAHIALVLTSLQLQAQFALSGEFRPRAEYRHGYRTLATDDMNPAFFIEQRARLNLDYFSPGYQLKIVLQDVRTWGNEPQLVNDDGKWTTIHQAWAKVFFSEKFAVKLGRQEINYDDERIFGPVGWAQQARSHDAAIFQFNQNGWKADLGFAFNQDRPLLNTTYYSVPSSYKAFQTLWINKITENFEGSILFLNNGQEGGTVEDPKTNYSQTLGPRLGGAKNLLSGHFELYYQGGKMADGITSIDASLIGFDVGYKLSNQTSMLVGFQRLSGNSQTDQDTTVNNAFAPFYGTNHKFNGLIDYFYVGNHFGSVGLNDLYVRLSYAPSKFVLSAFIHAFAAANDVADLSGTGKMDTYLGTELDVVLGFNLAKGVKFNTGYSQMFATSTIVALKGGAKDATSNWAWAMITVKPIFFSTSTQ